MKINSTVASEALNLNGEAVAKVDYLVENFTTQSKMEHRSALRTRISVEEVLLCWMDHFGEGTAFSFSMGYHYGVSLAPALSFPGTVRRGLQPAAGRPRCR